MDTTSSALSRILQILTEDQSAQDKLRAELSEATANGNLNFDDIYALPYLEAVVRETLRLYVCATVHRGYSDLSRFTGILQL